MSEVVSIVAWDGTTYVLDGSGGLLLLERQDFFMPPGEFSDYVVPLQDGSRLKAVRKGMRSAVALKVLLKQSTAAGLRALLREMGSKLDVGRDVVIRCDMGGGDVRLLTCRYWDGLNLEEAARGSSSWIEAVIVFAAHDPYWYMESATTVTIAPNVNSAKWFGGKWFPLRLSSSQIYGDLTVNNGGDATAWPVWGVQGPGLDPRLINRTSGKILRVSQTLLVGDVLVIDTRPGFKSVKLNGSRLSGALSTSGERSLWGLEEGDNDIRVEMTGSTDQSLVTLDYYERSNVP